MPPVFTFFAGRGHKGVSRDEEPPLGGASIPAANARIH